MNQIYIIIFVLGLGFRSILDIVMDIVLAIYRMIALPGIIKASMSDAKDILTLIDKKVSLEEEIKKTKESK